MGSRTKAASLLRTNSIPSAPTLPGLAELRGQVDNSSAPAQNSPSLAAAYARRSDELRDAFAPAERVGPFAASGRPMPETLLT
jgi:hypothetical protein